MKTMRNEKRKEGKRKALSNPGVIRDAVENQQAKKLYCYTDNTAQKLKKAIDEMSRKMESGQMDI